MHGVRTSKGIVARKLASCDTDRFIELDSDKRFPAAIEFCRGTSFRGPV
jgi:hypothetical protein